MKTIPIIKRVGVNSGTGIAGTFLDGEFVFHYLVQKPEFLLAQMLLELLGSAV